MNEPTREKISRWSLERVQFVFSHLEDFVDEEASQLREQAKHFVAQSGLNKIEQLSLADPQDPNLPRRVHESLAAFFDAGLLLQRGLAGEGGNWWLTDIFWRGQVFRLELKEQIRANPLVPEMTPLQIHRSPSSQVFSYLKLPQLAPVDSVAYLLKPTPMTAFILFSNLGPPWVEDHMIEAQRLINKSFIF